MPITSLALLALREKYVDLGATFIDRVHQACAAQALVLIAPR